MSRIVIAIAAAALTGGLTEAAVQLPEAGQIFVAGSALVAAVAGFLRGNK